MTALRCAPWCVFALAFLPSLASADEASLVDWARTRVATVILRPLAERGGRVFTRARPPPAERRVRVLATTASTDKSGRPFVPFAVDVRFGGGEWVDSDILGCVYVGKGDLFVKRGDGYRPVAFLFGKNADPVPGACEAAPVAPARASAPSVAAPGRAAGA